jgi:epoxyqueuosine reductase
MKKGGESAESDNLAPESLSSGGRDLHELLASIRAWGGELGFQSVGVSDTDLTTAEARLTAWLDKGYHGELDYMARHGTKRTRPAELAPGTIRIISARMNYLAKAPDAGVGSDAAAVLASPSLAYISRYALGRDYHKVLRSRLQALADRIAKEVGPFGYRVFTDSAPVMEVELGRKSGLGWRGKHTLLLSREAGSSFFLGEIYTDLPLPVDVPVDEHCGTCTRCISACPTGAIVAPYQLDARRCISYLTIELKGAIPEELRPLIGNRVYGCDDCQLECPWNKFAQVSMEPDFRVRHGLDHAELLSLWAWNEQDFRTNLAGSAIVRIGYERWQRNLAVAMGNALHALRGQSSAQDIAAALRSRRESVPPMVREHLDWALSRYDV